MADIKINYAAAREKAAQMRTKNAELTQTLEDTQKVINQLEVQWTSDASDTIRRKITGMQATINKYQEAIESYAKHIEASVVKYENNEASANAAAEAFM